MFPDAAGSIVFAGACDTAGVSRAGAEAAVAGLASVGAIGLEGACTGAEAPVVVLTSIGAIGLEGASTGADAAVS